MSITAAQVAELRALTGAGLMDCKKALEETGGNVEAARDYLRKRGISVAQKKSARETKEGGIAIEITADRAAGAMVRLASETDFVARNNQFQTLLKALAHQALAQGPQDLAAQPALNGGGTVGDRITAAIASMGENLQLLQAERVQVSGGVVGGYVHSNGRIGVLVALQAEGQADPAALQSLARDLAMHIAASPVSAIRPDQVSAEDLRKEREIYTAQAAESGKPPEIVAKMVQGRMNKYLKEVTLLNQPFVKDPEKTVEKLLAEQGQALGAKLTVERFVKMQF